VETPLVWGDVFAEAGQDVLAEAASPGGDEEEEGRGGMVRDNLRFPETMKVSRTPSPAAC
jgi:hypothetical protein